ncbi:hypothetical protein CBS101457_000488 [Exobasidium rhododendri]|nr:hypothetical protein CBS101457_000488 [Exobasidium rhododendri]
MSRSFFAPDAKAPASPSDPARTPFLSNGNTSSEALREEPKVIVDAGAKATITSLAPILSYCGASITMTVVNKFVLKTHFSLNLIVLLIQSVVGCLLVVGAQYLRWIELRPLNSRDVQNWIPISTALVFVIWTGSKALQFLSIPVYTIFKNLTIILIAYGEVIWFGGKVTSVTLVSFGLMVLSSVVAAFSDISKAIATDNLSMPHTPDSLSGGTIDPNTHFKSPVFDPLGEEKANILAMAQGGQDQVLDGIGGFAILNSGYVWMALNCAFSAAYVLAMRKRIKVTGFKDWDTMFYNNLLTIPILIVMSLLVEDWSRKNFETNFPLETRFSLLSAIIFSGACAVFISYTTAWCIRATSSTTYSMVGALNKLPLALSGMVFFGDAVTLSSTSAIGLGFVAGLVYAYAKNKQSQDAKRALSTAATNVEHTRSGSGSGRNEGIIPMHQINGNGKDIRND